MRELQEKILREGSVYPGGVLKVDGFLNHRLDTGFVLRCGKEIADAFKGDGVTKVLTVEASGIAPAFAAACVLDVPLVYGKKARTSNLSPDVYSAVVHSFTHGVDSTVLVSRDYLSADDCVLIVDDFLAEGNAVRGLMEISLQAGCRIAGCAAVIEKGFQGGGDALRAQGVKVVSLAIVDAMSDGGVTFRPDGSM